MTDQTPHEVLNPSGASSQDFGSTGNLFPADQVEESQKFHGSKIETEPRIPGKSFRADFNTASKTKLYTIMVMMLLFGAYDTIVLKAQDMFEVEVDGEMQEYTHPYFQCLVMFCGQALCLIIYFSKKYCCGPKADNSSALDQDAPKEAGGLKTSINPVWLLIPASCDVGASTCMFIGLTQCDASVYQMLRAMLIPVVATFSIVFLKNKYYLHHYVSIVAIVVGVAIVGLVSVQSHQGGGKSTTTVFGAGLIMGAQLLTATQMIVEERLFKGYQLDQFMVVGTEGAWGICYWAVLLPIFQKVHCDGPLCHNGYLENSALAFEQYGRYPALILFSLSLMCSIASFNTTAVSVTKYASAAQRSTIDASRTVLIWAFSLAIGWEEFLPWQLLGFLFLITGTLVFNEIIVIPWKWFSKGTKQALEGDGRQSTVHPSFQSIRASEKPY